MKILFISDNFPPEVNAPASRTYEHCLQWVRAGHEVTVITCAPNFPTGRVYQGYRNRLRSVEMIDGIRVVRVGTLIAANEGFVLRILDYLSFMVSATLASIFERRPDVVVGTSPQFFAACGAWLIARIKCRPFVFELRDIWPESIRAVGAMKSSKALNMLEWVEMYLYQQSSAIISVTNAFRDRLIQRGIDGKKIHVVTNGVDISRFSPREKDAALLARHRLENKFIVGYIGTHGMAHALETVLDAASKLKRAPDGDQFRFILLGDGANKSALINRAQNEGLDNIIFIDSVPKAEVVRYWSLLDASIIHLKKTELFTAVIPSKIFECMGMGIPLLHGVQGESAAIVEREDVGLLFEPENADSLILSLRRLADDSSLSQRLKTNGPIAAQRYDRSALAENMLDVLQSCEKH